jgi:hypothetical protein
MQKFHALDRWALLLRFSCTKLINQLLRPDVEGATVASDHPLGQFASIVFGVPCCVDQIKRIYALCQTARAG